GNAQHPGWIPPRRRPSKEKISVAARALPSACRADHVLEAGPDLIEAGERLAGELRGLIEVDLGGHHPPARHATQQARDSGGQEPCACTSAHLLGADLDPVTEDLRDARVRRERTEARDLAERIGVVAPELEIRTHRQLSADLVDRGADLRQRLAEEL